MDNYEQSAFFSEDDLLKGEEKGNPLYLMQEVSTLTIPIANGFSLPKKEGV